MNKKLLKVNSSIKSWISIGDLHGDVSKLTLMLRKIENLPYMVDAIIFLGDIISESAGGGKILYTIKSIKSSQIEFIYGNHDVEFLNAYNMIRSDLKKKNQFLEYFGLCEEIMHWFDFKGIYSLELESAFLSHAGLDDRFSLSEQSIENLIYSSFKENLNHITQKLVIQAHIPMKKVKTYGNHWFLDTGCGYGGSLSALIYPSMEILNVT